MPDPPNKLCVLADRYIMANEVRTLENAIERTDVTVPLVIVNDPPDAEINPDTAADAINERLGLRTVRLLFDVAKRDRAWTVVFAEKKLAEMFGSEMSSTSRVHVESVSCLSNSEIRYVTPQTDGNWSELPSETVDLVRKRCDLGIRFGFGLLSGGILRAPEFGVISFHPADIRQYRGLGVPQVWLDGRDTMGVTLQRLTDEIDGGEIVAYEETDVSGCATLWDVYDTLYDLKADLLARGIENLRDPPFETTIPESLGPCYSIERRYGLSFAGQTLYKNLSGRLRRAAGR